MIVTGSCRMLGIGVLPSVAAGAVALLLVGAAVAQNAPGPQLGVVSGTEPQLQTAPAEGQSPQRSKPPGLFGAIGRWMDESIGSMTSGWNSAREVVGDLGGQASEAAKEAAGAARDAAATVVRIPATSFVTGRKHCLQTANGGPDCETAAETLCRSKGYSAGTSLHIQSEKKCPVWGWIAGKKPVGECGTETYVTSAICR